MNISEFRATLKIMTVADYCHTIDDGISDLSHDSTMFVYAESFWIERKADGRFYLLIERADQFGPLETLEEILFDYARDQIAEETTQPYLRTLHNAAQSADLDIAVRAIQDALGVETGDFAGMHFQNVEDWPTLPVATRFEILCNYAIAEINFGRN